jgi:hypothetical protein
LVKRSFKTCLGRRFLSEIEFRTFTKETEACLNARPLTFVSTEGDGFMPLRPADFLVLHADLPLAIPEANADSPAPAEALRRRWKAQRAYLDHFWRRFASEYLTNLRDKAGWNHPKKRPSIGRTPRIGEPVLVEVDFTARNLWPMAIVDDLEIRAGAVRNAVLRLPDGALKTRPLNRLYPLEIREEEPTATEPVEPPELPVAETGIGRHPVDPNLEVEEEETDPPADLSSILENLTLDDGTAAETAKTTTVHRNAVADHQRVRPRSLLRNMSICRQVRKNLGDCFHAFSFFLRRCFPHRRTTTHPAIKRRGKYRLVQSAGWGLAALLSHGPSVETVSPDTLVLTARSE